MLRIKEFYGLILSLNYLIMIKVLFWNCRGAGSSQFQRFFHQYKLTLSPDIMDIFEPRISGLNVDNAIKQMGYPFSHRIEVQGFKQAIWVLWKPSVEVSIIANSL